MTFASAHPALARTLAARGYASPTPVQLAVLEGDAAGRDLLVSAQTGSGKTVAFGLAAAPALLGAEERLGPAGAPLALIIAPTRELALQVQRELSWLYGDTGARVVTCVGGMDPKAEARQLGYGAHIVVGTPGRLRDHIERGRLDFTTLKTVVLDEADEMLDLGFREDLEFILDATPESRQTLLFSATMPREIEQLAQRYQREAARIQTLKRNEQHADIDYRAIRVAPSDIEHAVVNVLRFNEARAAIVFCSTREAVKRLSARLAERGFSAVALSGELTQNERSHALQALRDGRARVLVATDVAARGLDLPDLALVIHADLPHDPETLLHRSGRTGRAGNKGLSVLIVPFNRRRKAEGLLAGAKLKVTWTPVPTADEIRARDQERFLADAIFSDAGGEDELAVARTLQGARSADEIALALVRLHRDRLPAPEDLAEDTGPPPRREFGRDRPERRGERRPPREGEGRAWEPRDAGPPPNVRDQGREMVWFRVDIGRERNAEPRWLLPLICRAGNVSKSEVGAIKIFDRDTRFQVAAEFADAFAEAARNTKPNEARISRLADRAPHEGSREERRPHFSERRSRDEVAASDAAPREDGAKTDGPKKPWRDRGERRDDGGAHRNAYERRPKNEAAASEGARRESGATPDRPTPDRPKKPWRDGGERRDGAAGPRNGGDRWKSDRPHRDADGPRGHGRTELHGPGAKDREPGHDKGAPSRGGHRKGGFGKGGFGKGGFGKGGPGKGGHGAPAGGRPTSKYAHKKKHRAAPPAKG